MNNKEKQIRKSEGITLIALVITIIILIILAGVSINLILDKNGIAIKAKEGKENMQIAEEEEKDILNKVEGYIKNNVKVVIRGPVAGGNYDNPYIPAGFTHTEGEGTWNSGYIIRDELGNEFVWVPCVLDQEQVKEGDKVETFKKTLPATTATTDPYYLYNKSNLTIIQEEGTSATEIEKSVESYGGFYIARYEAGIEGTTENYLLEEKTPTTTKPLSKKGKGVWNYITRTDAITVAASMINTQDGVKSSLISGACWDTTLQWIVNVSENSQNEPNLGYDINSTEKGWYFDISDMTRHTTGYYSVNNIYDIAGNVWEWTTENCTKNGTNYIVSRGGRYYDYGYEYPAAYRDKNSTNKYDGIGFRVVLYK